MNTIDFPTFETLHFQVGEELRLLLDGFDGKNGVDSTEFTLEDLPKSKTLARINLLNNERVLDYHNGMYLDYVSKQGGFN